MSKIEVYQCCTLSETGREEYFPCLSLPSGGLLAILGVPWFIDGSLQSLLLSSYGLFPWVSVSLRLCICLSSLSNKDISRTGLRAHSTQV